MIIPINVVKLFDKIQHPFEIKLSEVKVLKRTFSLQEKASIKNLQCYT